MNAWLIQHHKALQWALRHLAATPLNTLLSWLAIGVALALPAGGHVLLINTMSVARHASSTPQISVFMQAGADQKSVDWVASRLAGHPDVGGGHFNFVSRETAIRHMQADASIAELISALPENPLPDAFIVSPHTDDLATMERLRQEFDDWPKVEHVQLDSAWVRRLNAVLYLGRSGVVLLTLLLGAGLVAIIFTTIRLQILTRRTEIEVSRLLGATDSFIRRPFYYSGILQGIGGGLVSWLIVSGSMVWLREPVENLALLYDTRIILQELSWQDSLVLIGLAAGLGWMGAALSLGRYLRGADLS